MFFFVKTSAMATFYISWMNIVWYVFFSPPSLILDVLNEYILLWQTEHTCPVLFVYLSSRLQSFHCLSRFWCHIVGNSLRLSQRLCRPAWGQGSRSIAAAARGDGQSKDTERHQAGKAFNLDRVETEGLSHVCIAKVKILWHSLLMISSVVYYLARVWFRASWSACLPTWGPSV